MCLGQRSKPRTDRVRPQSRQCSRVCLSATGYRSGFRPMTGAARAAEAPLLSVIVLTRDEELNLPFCLDSLRSLYCEVFVVDSGSTDRTVAIAREFGAHVVQHPFENQARQMNWALDNLPLRGAWTMRIDADERLTPELAAELRA